MDTNEVFYYISFKCVPHLKVYKLSLMWMATETLRNYCAGNSCAAADAQKSVAEYSDISF